MVDVICFPVSLNRLYLRNVNSNDRLIDVNKEMREKMQQRNLDQVNQLTKELEQSPLGQSNEIEEELMASIINADKANSRFDTFWKLQYKK